MSNAIENLRHLIDNYGWRDSRDMQDFIDAADMIDMQYVELPKDADGVEIRVGDDMEVAVGVMRGEHSPVEYFVLTKDGWEVDGEPPQNLRHRQPDTWEQIIADAYMRGAFEQYTTEGRIVDVKLEGDYDLVARCKALASDATKPSEVA